MMCATCRGILETVHEDKQLSCRCRTVTVTIPAFHCPHCLTTWVSERTLQALRRLKNRDEEETGDIAFLGSDSDDEDMLFNFGLL